MLRGRRSRDGLNALRLAFAGWTPSAAPKGGRAPATFRRPLSRTAPRAGNPPVPCRWTRRGQRIWRWSALRLTWPGFPRLRLGRRGFAPQQPVGRLGPASGGWGRQRLPAPPRPAPDRLGPVRVPACSPDRLAPAPFRRRLPGHPACGSGAGMWVCDPCRKPMRLVAEMRISKPAV